jgi:hypothetical protein
MGIARKEIFSLPNPQDLPGIIDRYQAPEVAKSRPATDCLMGI